MLSARQLLLMRCTRDRRLVLLKAPFGTVVFSQTQTSGGVYCGVSVILGSRVSLDG